MPEQEKKMRQLEDEAQELDDASSSFMVDFLDFSFAGDASEDDEEHDLSLADDVRNLAAKPVEDSRSRSFNIDLIIEAKVDPERPLNSVLTFEHFKEIARFE